MIINKQCELFVRFPQKSTILPHTLRNPGDFFSYTKAIDGHNKFNYSSMGFLAATAGARSLFILPSICSQLKFAKLNRELKIKVKQPTDMYQHFNLFKNILNSEKIHTNWFFSLIYFSESWINSIKNNPAWFEVQKYFYRTFVQRAIYQQNTPYYETAYSVILEKTNQKPNPYLFDTFKHLLNIMTGETPGFSPLTNNDIGPIEALHDIFTKVYGLNNIPTLMGPSYFNLGNENPERKH